MYLNVKCKCENQHFCLSNLFHSRFTPRRNRCSRSPCLKLTSSLVSPFIITYASSLLRPPRREKGKIFLPWRFFLLFTTARLRVNSNIFGNRKNKCPWMPAFKPRQSNFDDIKPVNIQYRFRTLTPPVY